MDAAQSLYFSTHGSLSSTCQCGCGKATEWNYKTGKPYKVSPDPTCRKRLYERAEKNMQAARHTSVHSLLNDMEHQKEMQAHRPTYGKYKFPDGGEVEYLSNPEKNFLQFCDVVMDFTSNMILPSPEVFTYHDPNAGVDRKYIPDYYLPDYNLIIEIKDGGKAENTNPAYIKETKYKVALKDDVMRKQTKYNYIRINGANYGPFVETLYQIVHVQAPDKKPHKTVIVVTESACIDIDEMVALTAPEVPQPGTKYYLMVGKMPGTNLHTVTAISRSRIFANWYASDMVKQTLRYTNYQDPLIRTDNCEFYQYCGTDDFGPAYSIIEQLATAESEQWDILEILYTFGIFFDNGRDIYNNLNRRTMFSPVNINDIVKDVTPVEPELFTNQNDGSEQPSSEPHESAD